MKRKILISMMLLAFIGTGVQAQSKKAKRKTTSQKEVAMTPPVIESKKEEPLAISEESKKMMEATKVIFISTNVFVQMVFNSTVQVVRSGAPEAILSRNEENIVTLQGLKEGVRSNITVKTADGLYYSYKVVSEDVRDIPLFYNIPIADAVNAQTKLIEDQKKKIVEKMSTQEVAQTIYSFDGFIKNRNSESYKGISLSINGVYIDKGKLFFLLKLANKTNIDYKIEKIKFFTAPVKKSNKRVENEEKEFIPLFFYKEINLLKAKNTETIVAVFDQFTLNDQKKMEITMNEEAGERTVKLAIDSKKISNAKQP